MEGLHRAPVTSPSGSDSQDGYRFFDGFVADLDNLPPVSLILASLYLFVHDQLVTTNLVAQHPPQELMKPDQRPGGRAAGKGSEFPFALAWLWLRLGQRAERGARRHQGPQGAR